jgi:nucleoside-diphosphate-sugar epimerase
MLKNKKILITGGAGFIGHNLALKLKKLGSNVEVVDSLNVNNIYNLKKNENKLPYPKLALRILKQRFLLLKKNKIKLNIIDIKNFQKINKYVKKFKPEVVIHLSAVSHAARSNKDPQHTFDNSLVTLQNMLEITKNNIKQFIFLSSSMVYGNFTKKNVKENQICKPIGIYGALKFSAEKLIKGYSQVYDLPYTIIRPSALYGERCISRRVGQILINGDGKEKLDFTYIDDLVDGIVCAIKSKNSIKETFNITFGNSKSINFLLDTLKKEFPKASVDYIKRDKLMPVRGTLNINKAKKLINFSPQWSLNKGYPKYIKWYKKIYKT